MKVCPQCHSTDVPERAKQCPYCLYRYEEMKKPESEQQFAKKTGGYEGNTNNKAGIEELEESKANMDKIQRKGEMPTSSRETSKEQSIPKKFDKGKWIILIIVVVAVIIGIKACSTNKEEVVDVNAESVVEEEPTPEPIEEEDEIPYADEYILPNSNNVYLTEEDLAGLTKEELRIARNEIYARHGRKFNDSGLQSYFDSKSWYVGTILPEDFTESYAAAVFNQYELANKDFIAKYESTH